MNAGVVSEPPSAKLTPPKLILEFANAELATVPNDKVPEPSVMIACPDEPSVVGIANA